LQIDENMEEIMPSETELNRYFERTFGTNPVIRKCDCGNHRACTCSYARTSSIVVQVSTSSIILRSGEVLLWDSSDAHASETEEFITIINGYRMVRYSSTLKLPVFEGNTFKQLVANEVVLRDPNNLEKLQIYLKSDSASELSLKTVKELEYWDRQSRTLKTIKYYDGEDHKMGRNFSKTSQCIKVFNNRRFTEMYSKKLSKVVYTLLNDNPWEFITKAMNGKMEYVITNTKETPFGP
jgi:hypothetical protein